VAYEKNEKEKNPNFETDGDLYGKGRIPSSGMMQLDLSHIE
jgi:hypothetical protein